jgi:hypothetical protein
LENRELEIYDNGIAGQDADEVLQECDKQLLDQAARGSESLYNQYVQDHGFHRDE